MKIENNERNRKKSAAAMSASSISIESWQNNESEKQRHQRWRNMWQRKPAGIGENAGGSGGGVISMASAAMASISCQHQYRRNINNMA